MLCGFPPSKKNKERKGDFYNLYEAEGGVEIYTNEKQQPVLGHTMNLERGLCGSPLIYREND